VDLFWDEVAIMEGLVVVVVTSVCKFSMEETENRLLFSLTIWKENGRDVDRQRVEKKLHRQSVIYLWGKYSKLSTCLDDKLFAKEKKKSFLPWV